MAHHHVQIGHQSLRSHGPLVEVRIGCPVSATDAVFLALVDTGASENLISAGLARRLDLPLADPAVPVQGIMSGAIVNRQAFGAQLLLGTDLIVDGRFVEVPLTHHPPVDCVIGRPILAELSMTYAGFCGSVLLSG